MNQEVPREQWHCANCLMTGTLDLHGRCGTCGSGQVASEQARGLSRDARECAELEKMLECREERR
jgi:hypothetical protein